MTSSHGRMRSAVRAVKKVCPIATRDVAVGEVMKWRHAKRLAPPRHHGYFELVAPFV